MSVCGASLAFDRLGQGPTVVLLHGVGGQRHAWTERGSATLAALARRGFETYAVDLPGYGDSHQPPAATVGDMADTLADWMQSRQLDRAVVVGHSMGGMVAQEMAARHPHRVAGLVLACTSAAFGRADGAWQAQFVADRLAPLEAGLSMADVASRLVPSMLGENPDPLAASRAIEMMSQVPAMTYRASVQALVRFDRRETLGAIAVPTLCLAGERDTTAPAKVLQKMCERIAGAAFQVIAGAGHLANLERPAQFNQALGEFLGRHFQPALTLSSQT